ncbi:MAG: hypothetical protein K2N30_01515 [Clostridia bacterium]|nr:hypothetical protein [Clostridia bacterium]
MKKFLISVTASFCLLCGCLFGFTACSDGHAHQWNAGEITVQPTCAKEGTRTFQCTVDGCGETKTEAVEKISHSWDEGVVTAPAKCDAEGVKTYTCGVCKTNYTEPLEKIAHTYDNGKLTVIPDIHTKGGMLYTCSACGGTKTDSVAPRADYGEQFYNSLAEENAWVYGYFNDTDAFTRITESDEQQPEVWKADGVEIKSDWIYASNKTAVGYRVNGDMQINVAASFVGDGENTDVSARLLNTDAAGTVISEAALGGDGKDWSYASPEVISAVNGGCVYIVFVNNGTGEPCGRFSFRLTLACAHVWDEGTQTKSASCTENGEIVYECIKCGDTKSEQTAMIPHDYEHGILVEIDGETHGKQCGSCTAIDPSTAVSHNLVAGNILKAPTDSEDGEEEVSCPDCGYSGTRVIPALNHVMGETLVAGENTHWYTCVNPDHNDCAVKLGEEAHDYTIEVSVTPATCESDGLKVTKCECGKTHEEVLPMLTEHAWDDGEVTVQPTFSSKGETTYTCSVCGETKTEEIAAKTTANYTEEFSATDYANGPWGYHGIDYDWGIDNIKNAFGVDGVIDDYLVRKDGETVKCEIKADEIMADWMCAVSYTVTDAMKMLVNLSLAGGVDVGIDVRITVVGADGTLRMPKADYFGMNIGSALEITNREYDLQAGDTIYFIFSDKGEASSHKSPLTLELTRKE